MVTPPAYATLDEWISQAAIPFAVDSPAACNSAIDAMIAALGDAVDLLGFGECLHGGEELLILRNRLFARLVEAHGFRAIAIESCCMRGRLVQEYVAGRGPASYAAVQDAGFSYGFGAFAANRELVEWMRAYNADPAHRIPLNFYGFDMPAVTADTALPHETLRLVLDYMTTVDGADAESRSRRIAALLGDEARWENIITWPDPGISSDLLADILSLRLEIEDLISDLRVRRPELVEKRGAAAYAEALHTATVARQLLNFFVALARGPGLSAALGVRDAMMADNVADIARRERGRGKVLIFAHNGHLQREQTTIPTEAGVHTWWPAGAHIHQLFGPRYAVIGSAIGTSDANGIGRPEPGTLEARITAGPSPAVLLPTQGGQGLPAAEIAALPVRSASTRNPSYQPLTPRAFAGFDWLAVLDSTAYARGGPPDAGPEQ